MYPPKINYIYEIKSPNNEKMKNNKNGIRVLLYLVNFDEVIWATMPSRINLGDDFHMDCFVGKNEKKTLEPKTYQDLKDGLILYCDSIIWNKDDIGIYQQVYLTRK